MVEKSWPAEESKAESASVFLRQSQLEVLKKCEKSKVFLTLNKNREFSFLYKRGNSFISKYFVTYAFKKKWSQKRVRVGITTSKKVGCAVKRNRARRLLKESFRSLAFSVSPKFDIVFVARNSICCSNYDEVFKNMKKHLIKLGCLNK